MDRLLARLERRFGRYAIHGLTWYLIGAQAAVFVLLRVNPEFVFRWLTFNREAILHGEVWRLVTFLWFPHSNDILWIFFELYLLQLVGTSLEAQWGAFKYQAFWLLGIVLTTGVAFAFNRPADNFNLLLSLFLAFATLFPDFELLVLMILPVKVKWLALLDAVVITREFIQADGVGKLVPLAAVANYLIFFAPELVDIARRGSLVASRTAARQRFRGAEPPPREHRTCALCGLTDADPSVEFRVCTCAKCGKPTDYCLKHARNH